MHGLTAVSLAILIWGSQAFASLSIQSSDQRKTVQSWAAHLNSHYDAHYYPTLGLRVIGQGDIDAVLYELKLLEMSIRDEIQLPPNSLPRLCCVRPECGNK